MNLLLAAMPAITAVIGCIVSVVKNSTIIKGVVEKVEELRNEVYSTKEFTELKEQYKQSLAENRALKKKLNELLVKIDHIRRNEED